MALIFKFPVVKILIFVLMVVFVECYRHQLKSRLASVASETALQQLLEKHTCMSALNPFVTIKKRTI